MISPWQEVSGLTHSAIERVESALAICFVGFVGIVYLLLMMMMLLIVEGREVSE